MGATYVYKVSNMHFCMEVPPSPKKQKPRRTAIRTGKINDPVSLDF